MKKIISVSLVLLLLFSFVACEKSEESDTIKVGMVCIGNDQMAYDRNFYSAADNVKAKLAEEGIEIEWLYTFDHAEGDEVTTDCAELANQGCIAIFCNSYGQEPAMLTVASDYPDTIFIGMTNEASMRDKLTNTVNAFPSVYEGRYLTGVIAGCKLNEMIEAGEITEEEAIIGYVGAYAFAEVISGYTAFYLGAKSVCPSVTMKVNFVQSWGNPSLEAEATQTLIENGAVLISQHSDSTTPATKAQENGVYHVGYNISMLDAAPGSSLVSCRIDWTNYMYYVIKSCINKEEVVQDYMGHGIKESDVVLTEINTALCSEETIKTVEAAEKLIASGELHVFDTSTFTVDGKQVTSYLVDMTGDYIGDAGYEAIFDGYFHESYFKSAPSFDLRIDGITLLN